MPPRVPTTSQGPLDTGRLPSREQEMIAVGNSTVDLNAPAQGEGAPSEERTMYTERGVPESTNHLVCGQMGEVDIGAFSIEVQQELVYLQAKVRTWTNPAILHLAPLACVASHPSGPLTGP
jgi:hypothetical protein